MPKASIHVHRGKRRRLQAAARTLARKARAALGMQKPAKRRRRLLVHESKFAHAMRVSDFCLVMCGDTPTSRRIFDAIVADCIPLIAGSRLWGRCEKPCVPGWGWYVSGQDHPHTPFSDTLLDYTRFPRIDEAAMYKNAPAAYAAATRAVTERMEHDLWRYMNAIRSDVIYGWGNAATSDKFGRAPINLLDAVVLRLRHGGAVPAALRPADHSPLDAYDQAT